MRAATIRTNHPVPPPSSGVRARRRQMKGIATRPLSPFSPPRNDAGNSAVPPSEESARWWLLFQKHSPPGRPFPLQAVSETIPISGSPLPLSPPPLFNFHPPFGLTLLSLFSFLLFLRKKIGATLSHSHRQCESSTPPLL